MNTRIAILIITSLFGGVIFFSCRTENQNIYLETEINKQLIQFDSQIEAVKKRNGELVKIQKNEHLINYPFTTYADSIKNIKISELNHEIETIVSSHNETLYELIQRQKKAKQFFENLKENNPKNPSIDWYDHQNDIDDWLKHEFEIDSISKIWKNKLNIFIENYKVDSTNTINSPTVISIPSYGTDQIQPSNH